MEVVDAELAARVERAMMAQLSGFVAAAARVGLVPGVRPEWIECCGGGAAFVGAHSPVSKAVNVGMGGPVPGAELDRLEAFFRDRGGRPLLEVCPLADATLHSHIRQREYNVAYMINAYVRRVDAPWTDAEGAVRIERVDGSNVDAFARTLTIGFGDGKEPPEALREVYARLPHITVAQEGVACWLARIGGEPAGAGAVAVMDVGDVRVASLFGAATAPAARRRGVQTALLARRLAYAAACGAGMAVIHSRPGTDSERNIQRAGFRLAYTKLVVDKPV